MCKAKHEIKEVMARKCKEYGVLAEFRVFGGVTPSIKEYDVEASFTGRAYGNKVNFSINEAGYWKMGVDDFWQICPPVPSGPSSGSSGGKSESRSPRESFDTEGSSGDREEIQQQPLMDDLSPPVSNDETQGQPTGSGSSEGDLQVNVTKPVHAKTQESIHHLLPEVVGLQMRLIPL